MKIREIIKTDNILKFDLDETLSYIASQLSSSHDSAFIFDKEKYMGVVNPYYCFIKTWYPPHTKIENCLVHPPHIIINDPISRAAEMMIESKIHYLPVFENNKFKGIITARRLIKAGISAGFYQLPIGEYLKEKKLPVVIDENSDLATAINLFKQFKFSKLIVVNTDNRLKGVLSYYDLINVFTRTKERQHYSDRGGEKNSFSGKKIKNYFKTLVLTLDNNATLTTAAQMILDREIGSIIIVNDQYHPIGIITTKDLLLLLVNKRDFKLNYKVTYKNIDLKTKNVINRLCQKISQKVAKVSDHHLSFTIKKIDSENTFQIKATIYYNNKIVAIIEKDNQKIANGFRDLAKAIYDLLYK